MFKEKDRQSATSSKDDTINIPLSKLKGNEIRISITYGKTVGKKVKILIALAVRSNKIAKTKALWEMYSMLAFVDSQYLPPPQTSFKYTLKYKGNFDITSLDLHRIYFRFYIKPGLRGMTVPPPKLKRTLDSPIYISFTRIYKYSFQVITYDDIIIKYASNFGKKNTYSKLIKTFGTHVEFSSLMRQLKKGTGKATTHNVQQLLR